MVTTGALAERARVDRWWMVVLYVILLYVTLNRIPNPIPIVIGAAVLMFVVHVIVALTTSRVTKAYVRYFLATFMVISFEVWDIYWEYLSF